MDDSKYDQEVDNHRNDVEEKEKQWAAIAERMAKDIIEKEKRLKEICDQVDWGKPKSKKKKCKLL